MGQRSTTATQLVQQFTTKHFGRAHFGMKLEDVDNCFSHLFHQLWGPTNLKRDRKIEFDDLRRQSCFESDLPTQLCNCKSYLFMKLKN